MFLYSIFPPEDKLFVRQPYTAGENPRLPIPAVIEGRVPTANFETSQLFFEERVA